MIYTRWKLLFYVVIILDLMSPKIILASLSDILDQTIDTSHNSSQEIPMSQEAYKNAKIFICHSSGDAQNTELVRKLVHDLQTTLKFSDDDILFDEKNYAGQGLNIPEFIDNISCTPCVIIVGSSNFKEKYVNKKKYAGSIVKWEINNILQRRIEKGDKGLIPVWFHGEHRQCFPSCLRDLTAINFTDNYDIQLERLKRSFSGRSRSFTLRQHLRRCQSDNTSWVTPVGSSPHKRTMIASSDSNQNNPNKRQHVTEPLFNYVKPLQHLKSSFESQQLQFIHKTIYHLPDRPAYYLENSRYKDSATYLDILEDELDFTAALKIPRSYNKIVLTSMGGIGKTELAKVFAYQALDANSYDLIYWLNSTTTDHLKQSCKNLLSTLKTNYNDQASIIELSQLIKSSITSYRWLLIYDGAPHSHFLDDCIPQSQGHVLITSRCRYGWNATDIELHPFHSQDAVNYLIESLKLEKSSSNQQQASKIAHKLMYNPLLLYQAASDITYFKTSFEAYYADLNDKGLQLPVNPFNASPKLDYFYLTAQTWQQDNQMISSSAKDLLTYCAYLDRQTISNQYLDYIKPLHNSILSGFAQLDSFCLINKGQKFITMCPSLQYVIRLAELQKDYISVNDTPIFNLLNNFKQYAIIATNKHRVKTSVQPAGFTEFIPWVQKHLSSIAYYISTLKKHITQQQKFIDAYKAELNSIDLVLNIKMN